MRCGVDLKSAINDDSNFSEGRDHECKEVAVCLVDGLSAVVDIQPKLPSLNSVVGKGMTRICI